MDLTYKTDYVSEGQARLTNDNRGPNTKALVKAYCAQSQALEDGLFPLIALMGLPAVVYP